MKHTVELKMTSDDAGNLSVADTVLYIDGNAVGCVQSVNVEATVWGPEELKKKTPRIRVCFPDLSDTPSCLNRDIAYHVEILKQIPSIEVSFTKFHVYDIMEVGTNGCIDNLQSYKIEQQ